MKDPGFLSQFSIKVNVPVAEYTSIKAGGSADFFGTVSTESDLVTLLTGAAENQLKTALIGCGSGTVFSDSGWRGLLIKNDVRSFDLNHDLVAVGSGLPMSDLVHLLAKEERGGFEALVGYPGSVGGAIRHNVSRLGTKLSDQLRSVTLYSGGRVITVEPQDLHFTPGGSRLDQSGEWVLGATFKIKKKPPAEIKKRLLEATQDRLKSEPTGRPQVTIFTNPPSGRKAGELVAAAGMAGERVGKAMVSRKNPNVIINTGGAEAASVYELAQRMKHQVQQKTGRKLLEAVTWLGEM